MRSWEYFVFLAYGSFRKRLSQQVYCYLDLECRRTLLKIRWFLQSYVWFASFEENEKKNNETHEKSQLRELKLID